MKDKKKKSDKNDYSEKPSPAKLIAKKEFKIVCNDYVRDIKVGDDLSDLPEIFLVNMKTEGVL